MISSAITLAPYRHASPDETHSSDAPPVCAPALAKGPPRCYEASASRSDRMRDTDHMFIIYFYYLQTQTVGRRALLCRTEAVAPGAHLTKLVRVRNDTRQEDLRDQQP